MILKEENSIIYFNRNIDLEKLHHGIYRVNLKNSKKS